MYQPNSVPSSSSLVHNNGIELGQQSNCGRSTMESMSGGDSMNNNASLASKQRLRWTHELHERFVDAVAQLGGPDSEISYFCLANLSLLAGALYLPLPKLERRKNGYAKII